MTARIVFAVAFACTLTTTRAVDMRNVPPMIYEGPADIELKGRELEAIEVALRQFRQAHFSSSGDLKHFTIELRRRGGKLAISFFPEYDEHSRRALPGRNKYGTFVTYFVS